MLLNLFFENMNSKLELFLLGAFIFAIYWFVLRKYNALGLRLFVLCFLLFAGCCVWVYRDEQTLKKTFTTGEEHVATIISKATVGKNDHQVTVSFTANSGTIVKDNSSQYVSQEEWDKFEQGQALPVIYVAEAHQTFVKESILRFKADKIYLYYFSGFWLVLGVVLLIWLRKFKVKLDENTGEEWVVKEDGTIILDERKSKTATTLKHVNIISKMAQAFGKN